MTHDTEHDGRRGQELCFNPRLYTKVCVTECYDLLCYYVFWDMIRKELSNRNRHDGTSSFFFLLFFSLNEAWTQLFLA